MTAPDLVTLRDRIEAVDRKIIELIAERLKIVEGVIEAKLASASPFRDREREETLVARLRTIAAEVGVDPHAIERLYRVVMDLSVAHQEQAVRDRSDVPLRVTYQGVEGSYSHLAAQRRYGGRAGGALLTGHDSFRAAANAVLTGVADLALLPIENTTAGSINETYDLLAAGGLHITGEVVASIEHCLLALPGVALDELRVVISHPQALAQCHDFFAQHPHLTARPELDTAGSARRVASAGDRTLAAIASAAAAKTYGLAIVTQGIQTSAGNATRFVEIAPRPAPLPDDATAKTSLVLSLADRPGALGEVLMRFATRGLSLTKIESRPIPEAPFTYRFYVDVLGHAASVPFVAALDDIKPLTTELRVLGTYAAAQ
ncbi:MAG: prephenate dehydratase [Deltaproteobacteria bacterium]|nr:prephenate dehydratase [Deltaproteobacteria bacterium]MDQ3297835.1 prephenate dehydratase [Myxococcota bacterium]